jgi:PTS system mannitol-specific IIC component
MTDVPMMGPGAAAGSGGGLKANVQRGGAFLAGMVMPNIGAFIAWGLITALFIPTGWIPSEELGALVDPMIKYLLPLLIGYTGGRIVHGQRGAVIGAVATMGVVVGSDVPMFLGAMIAGPLSALALREFDRRVQHRVPTGFEMLVDNFSLGIIGGLFAVGGVEGIGPVVSFLTDHLADGVDWLVDENLLPFASIIVEPAKVLFLNNAINHGVLSPIGVREAAESGKSILFMVETNPGPGLGVLLAYWVAGPRRLRPTVPGAIVIQFLGGIHEIYFPYILMKPKLILAAICGGATGLLVFKIFGVGLVATPSPGSIFAYLAETPKGDHIGVLLGVAAAAGVSFTVGSLLLRLGREPEPAEETPPPAEEPRTTRTTATPVGA